MSPLVGRPALEGRHLLGRALLLLVAMLLASAPVSQVLAGSSWLVLTLVGAAPVILGGVVLRSVLRRQMLVPLLQAVVIVVLVLALELILGVLGEQGGGGRGGPVGALLGQSEILTRGMNELASGVPPLMLDPHGTVLVVALIALVTLLLDVMFLDLGWHTPTGLLLLCALLIPALQQPSGGYWWQVAAPVLAAAMIFATRTVHADPQYLRGDRRPQAGPLAHPGRTLAATAVCIALVVGLSPGLGPALPQLAPARLALNIDVLEQWRDPNAPAPGAVMIDDDISVRRSLLQQADTEVLRYTTTAGEDPSYLRLRALNRFDGETYRGDAEGEEPALGVDAFSDARDDGIPVHSSAGDLIDTDVEIMSLAGNRLPMPDNVRSVQGSDRSLNEAMTLQPSNGEVALGRVRTGLLGQHYSVRSEPRTATAEQLRAVDPAEFERPFDVGYTSRRDVPEPAAALAAEVAEGSGAETAFDTAVAYQDYFRTSFAYSLTVNSPPGKDPLESFLDDRVGYCEQFAATFALMMTSQGYPTRVVIGFTPGEQDGEEWTVSAKNAHAWPEVWFGPEHGWVRFEPTPAAAANGVSPPELTEQDGQEEAPAPEPETPEEQEEPTTEEENAEEGTTEEQTSEEAAAAQTPEEGTGPSTETVQRIEWGLVSVMAAGGLLAAAAATTLILIRRRRRRARDDRWAALLVGTGGTDGSTADGSSALAVERKQREAGELAWSELTRELAVRETAIRLLGITGAWGRPPVRIGLDPALPPHRALEDLLEQIDAGPLEVTAAHRAAADRIAEAYTTARYAAPLPPESAEEGVASAEGAPAPEGAPSAEGTPAQRDARPAERPQHPLRHDSDLLIELIRTAR